MAPSRARCSRSNAAPAGRRSRTSACSPEPFGCETGCDSAGTRRRRSPRSASSSAARPSSATSVAAGQIGKLWGLGDVQIGDTIGEPRTTHGAPLLRPADAGDGRRSPPPRRQGRAARRARPARRAGPADQPAPGRRPPGALRLALRRGAEGGHRGDARERLRPRRRVPRDDDDLHRAARRRRRGRRDRSEARTSELRSSPPSGCASSRPRPTPGCSSGWRSRSGRYRRYVYKTVEDFHEAMEDTVQKRCARASTDGRSPTAP